MSDLPSSEFLNANEIFPNNYNVLTARNQIVEGSAPWSTEWLLSEYTKCTDGLIGKFDGTIPLRHMDVYTQNSDGLRKEKKDLAPPTSVLFLDKSARPVEWMTKKLWPILARIPGSRYIESRVPKYPNSHFLNIDKAHWLRRMGVPQQYIEDPPENMINLDAIDKEQLARIRALYTGFKHVDENNLLDAWKYPTIFDGQHVMIVDEVKSSGNSLSIAQILLSKAIPEATFSGVYWATPKRVALNSGAEVDGRMQFKIEWVPVWYRADIESGRGVGDSDPHWPEIAEKLITEEEKEQGYTGSRLSKVGRHVLSTPPHNPDTHERIIDTKAMQLRTDIDHMSVDLAEHRILYRPSDERPSQNDEDFEYIVERIKSINNVSDYKQWIEKRDALKPKPR